LQHAIARDEARDAWRWFERNIDYRNDAALPLRRINHGSAGYAKTLAPKHPRRIQ
jgi:hypothetical protein